MHNRILTESIKIIVIDQLPTTTLEAGNCNIVTKPQNSRMILIDPKLPNLNLRSILLAKNVNYRDYRLHKLVAGKLYDISEAANITEEYGQVTNGCVLVCISKSFNGRQHHALSIANRWLSRGY